MALRLLALLGAVLVLAFRADAQPNVIVIVADDLGFGDVGYNGSEILTPHLDQLAAEGVVLDRFYSSPLCSPSRAGLLTGRYPSRMGIAEPVTLADTVGLPQAEVTIAEALRDVGYETAMVGKWHLGTDCHHHPTAHGFDSFLGNVTGGAQYFTRQTSVGPDWWRDFTPEVTEGYTTEIITAEAVDILSRPRDRPLFLYLPYTAPHTPLQAPADDLALYPDLPEPRRTYAAMVTNLDRGIGQIMAAVRASGEPTLVWFLSDNGGVETHGSDNGPLSGGKGQTWEGGIRVPSVVWYPEWAPRRIEHPVWYLDVMPTILQQVPGVSGLTLPFDGAAQGPQLAGERPSRALLDRRLISYRRTAEGGHWLAAQDHVSKYSERMTLQRSFRKFFRIRKDPYEQVNRMRLYPEIAVDLRREASALMAETPAWASRDTTLTETRPLALAECEAAVSPRSRVAAAEEGAAPATLSAITPNPSTGRARVAFAVPEAGPVRLTVVDARGRTVATLVDGSLAAGPHHARLGDTLAAGIYIVRLEAAGTVVTRRAVIAR